MSKEDIVSLLMILNVNIYANVILERSLRAHEGHIGVNESALTIMKQIWAQMNGVFRFSGIFSNLAVSLRICARGKKISK